jgi:hypothetical protein
MKNVIIAGFRRNETTFMEPKVQTVSNLLENQDVQSSADRDLFFIPEFHGVQVIFSKTLVFVATESSNRFLCTHCGPSTTRRKSMMYRG